MATSPEIDERKGLPSASGAYRYTNCPGSWAMQQQCPPLPESDEAASGTLEHAAQSGDVELDELTPEQREFVEKREEIADKFCQHALGKPLNDCIQIREDRLFIRGYFSGKPDLIVRAGDSILIVDYKTRIAPDAGVNLQGRWLVALAAAKWKNVKNIWIAFVSPLLPNGGSIAKYDEDAAADALTEATMTVAYAFKHGVERKTGDWCQYCPGKSRCPEAQGTATALALLDSNLIPALTGEKLASLLNILPTVYHVANAIEDEAKARIERGELVPGYQLKPGRKITTITDIGTVYARAMEFGITNEQFVSACKVTKKTMTDFIRTKGLKGKAVDDQWNEFCAGATETKNAAPSLEKQPKAIEV